MRLVACSECHAQYDVTGVIAATIACRCGKTLQNESLKPVDAEIQRCGACGAHAPGDTDVCDYCGAELAQAGDLSLICPECFARNAEAARFCTACGVAFKPEPLCVAGNTLPCPGCSASMPPSQVGGVGLNECPRCNGLWVPGENFTLLVQRAAETRRHAEKVSTPRVRGGNPADRAVRYRKCPECETYMHRTNYRRSSGVVLDICHEHGTWLDADELEEIAGFILSGGTTSSVLEEEAQKTGGEAAAAFARARVTEEYKWMRPESHTGSFTGSLLRILTELIS